ncbi:MAG: YggS family pyridoxal phosphate-dependent enzyme [Candidatus Phosphoribacter sp.]
MSELAERRAELAANLALVRTRIELACGQAGRDPHEVSLIVVTKYFPASDVRLLLDLGVHHYGENRDQEAGPKCAELRADAPAAPAVSSAPELTMHFIGQLQTNKAGSVARYADVVHTVDRPRLVSALDRGAQAAGRRLRALVQVDLEPERDPNRGGARPEDALTIAEAVDTAAHLELGGVMAVAPLGADPDEAFAALGRVARGIQVRFPSASWVSAGMSGDLEAAVRHGATHLRVGTAILGSRPHLR